MIPHEKYKFIYLLVLNGDFIFGLKKSKIESVGATTLQDREEVVALAEQHQDMFNFIHGVKRTEKVVVITIEDYETYGFELTYAVFVWLLETIRVAAASAVRRTRFDVVGGMRNRGESDPTARLFSRAPRS